MNYENLHRKNGLFTLAPSTRGYLGSSFHTIPYEAMKHLTVFLVLAIFTIGTTTAQSAEELFQQALRMERSSGDYAAAIKLYEQVASASDAERRLTAQALVRLGRAYESLGRVGADKAYRRVISEFGDIQDLAAEAQAGVRRLTTTKTKVSLAEKRPFSTTDIESRFSGWGPSLSPSGRFLASASKDGIDQVNIETGERKILVHSQEIELDDGTTKKTGSQFVRYSPVYFPGFHQRPPIN